MILYGTIRYYTILYYTILYWERDRGRERGSERGRQGGRERERTEGGGGGGREGERGRGRGVGRDDLLSATVPPLLQSDNRLSDTVPPKCKSSVFFIGKGPDFVRHGPPSTRIGQSVCRHGSPLYSTRTIGWSAGSRGNSDRTINRLDSRVSQGVAGETE